MDNVWKSQFGRKGSKPAKNVKNYQKTAKNSKKAHSSAKNNQIGTSKILNAKRCLRFEMPKLPKR
jgi:hypothetical protein